MFHKVKSVKTLDNYILLITFEDNTIKYYDVKNLFNKFKNFQDLININGLFKLVKVDNGGYGISWNENLDLSCEELWNNSNVNKL